MSLLFAKNQDWIDILCSFGLSKETAEDLCQEMYIKIQLKIEKDNLNIMYNDNEINYYYIFTTLRSLFIDYTRKTKRNDR